MSDQQERNAAGEIIHHDDQGREYILDEAGDRRPPMQTSQSERSSGFLTYDTSEGHCGLCGRLTCHGNCFK
jgi:hypothetical protein